MINGLYEQIRGYEIKTGVISKHHKMKANHKPEDSICKSLNLSTEEKKSLLDVGIR